MPLNYFRRSACTIFAGVIAASMASTAQAQQPKQKVASATREISFPTAFSLGRLFIYKRPATQVYLPNCESVIGSSGRLLGQARGLVKVPSGDNIYVFLAPSYDLLNHPEALRTLAPNSIDGLSFARMTLVAQVDKVIEPLSHLTGLRRLEIDGADLNDEQILPLKTLVNLDSITLVSNNLHGSFLKSFGGMKNLKGLDLSFNPLEPEAIKQLSTFKSLTDVRVCQCNITNSEVMELAKLPNLETLAINQSLVTREGLIALRKTSSLHFLNLNGCKLSVQDLAELKGSSIKRLGLPKHKYLDIELSALHQALPGVKLQLPSAPGAVDSDTTSLFAPLH
ncbi:MAG: hypothetical protein JSS83_11090 [Cyanobacteria bacterium SZAS LIN-3]|nr:hypothetical protein [Cyanobacteria bacterium SZAS LIN-3]MBS2005991.1 hypothetical protein [Cyanobacteria bacterium SZAS TMP-1]